MLIDAQEFREHLAKTQALARALARAGKDAAYNSGWADGLAEAGLLVEDFARAHGRCAIEDAETACLE